VCLYACVCIYDLPTKARSVGSVPLPVDHNASERERVSELDVCQSVNVNQKENLIPFEGASNNTTNAPNPPQNPADS